MQARYGLVGRSLAHSFSPTYFANFFAAHNIDARYDAFEFAEVPDLYSWAAGVPGLKGFNVTIPYKEEAFRQCDVVHGIAQGVGAVNAVRVHRRFGMLALHGFNTDVEGFAQTLAPLLEGHPAPPVPLRALVLGTGGASKAVQAGLRDLGIAHTVVGRLGGSAVLPWADVTPAVVQAHTVVVNCTPIGQWPNVAEAPPLPYSAFTAGHIAYDLVYNPSETQFLREAAAMGATTQNGLPMLQRQAQLAWGLWQ